MPQGQLDRLGRTGGGRVTALQILDVCLGVHGTPFRELRRLARGHLHRDLLGHRFRHPALQIQHILDFAVVAVSPHRFVRPGGDKLYRDAHAFADEERRSLEDGVHVQFARDLREAFLGALVLHGRSARDHPQRFEARKLGDERLGHAVREILLRGVA